jgi:DNA-binding response OmpR family regulator
MSIGLSNIDSAESTWLANELILSRSYDLVFVDLSQNEASGMECLDFFRKHDSLRSCLIIATADKASIRFTVSVMKAGADLLIKRPTSVSTLCLALTELLTSSHARKAKIVPIALGKRALRRYAKTLSRDSADLGLAHQNWT